VKIREILVRSQRSPRNAFGAARRTAPFDRDTGDKEVYGLQKFRIAFAFGIQRTQTLRLLAAVPTIEGRGWRYRPAIVLR
jgi:hypothetical protein